MTHASPGGAPREGRGACLLTVGLLLFGISTLLAGRPSGFVWEGTPDVTPSATVSASAADRTENRRGSAGAAGRHDALAPRPLHVDPRGDVEAPRRHVPDGGESEGWVGTFRAALLLVLGGALLGIVAGVAVRSVVQRRARSRTRLQCLAEAPSEGIVLHRNENVLDVNRAFTRMTGYDRDALVGRAARDVFAELMPDTERDGGRDEADTVYETTLVRADGTCFPAEVEEKSVDGPDQNLRVTAIRNVETRRRREEELRFAKEKAEQRAQLKSSLLSNMSHEFRTPITSILGYAELILEAPEADHSRFAEHIRQSGERLSRTLQTVLEMAQVEAGALSVCPRDVDVSGLVRDVLDEHRALAAEKDLSLTGPGPEACVACTDRRLLRRIVTHLVHNAIKFTPDGGVTVSVESLGSGVQVIVSDTGIGIDPSFRPRLFEPFTQETEGRRRTYEGTGLGLALIRRMVDLLEGAIEVDSEKGEGTTVAVELPALAATREPSAGAREAKPS